MGAHIGSRIKSMPSLLANLAAGTKSLSPAISILRLLTKWCYTAIGKHKNGEYKITKPDTDNMIKLLKDVMTGLGYWTDDAQVASEITEKFWSEQPGLYVRIEQLE